MKRLRNDRGFVLLNALVLVAAMAAAAVFLLARAEGGRARLAAGQQEQVLRHGLDAVEALSRGILNRDFLAGPVDGPADSWASPIRDVALARGRVSGQITDQQSLFNVNWLSDPEDVSAQEGIKVLLARIGVAPPVADALTAFVSAQGPSSRAAYQRLMPPVAPLGGPVFMLDQLLIIPEIPPQDFARLRPYLTALPTGSRVNVNTALAPVLAATLPQLPASRVPVILQRRQTEPYPSVEAFLLEFGLSTDTETDPDAVDPNRFSVGSNWFLAEITARDGTREAQRTVLLRRESAQAGTQVEWRISKY